MSSRCYVCSPNTKMAQERLQRKKGAATAHVSHLEAWDIRETTLTLFGREVSRDDLLRAAGLRPLDEILDDERVTPLGSWTELPGIVRFTPPLQRGHVEHAVQMQHARHERARQMRERKTRQRA